MYPLPGGCGAVAERPARTVSAKVYELEVSTIWLATSYAKRSGRTEKLARLIALPPRPLGARLVTFTVVGHLYMISTLTLPESSHVRDPSYPVHHRVERI